jgi:hypothetical protein
VIEGIADARVDPYKVGLGSVLFVQLYDQLLEGLVVTVEVFHVFVIAEEFGDGHDGVGERVFVCVLLGIEDVIDAGVFVVVLVVVVVMVMVVKV